MTKLSPSILSADFAILGKEVQNCLDCGAEYIHFDVCDGIFVPNITFGIPVLKSLRKSTSGFLDVHLMIDRPIRYVKEFCDSGADLVNIHLEADSEENNHKALDIIKGCGKKCGITIKPGTPAEAVLPFIKDVDLILIMTVVPGHGGQKFMTEQVEIIRRVREYIDELNPSCELEADGGINVETAPVAVAAGANVLVSGSAFFGAKDRKAAADKMKGIE